MAKEVIKDNLLIGYGNSLRSDDGVGPYLADLVASWQLPNWRVLSLFQLTPDLAAEISTAAMVIFVDAAINLSELQIKPLNPTNTGPSFGHSLQPQHLLSLTAQLYNHYPTAYWLLIPALNFDFGEEFSEITYQGIEAALLVIKQLIKEGGF